MSIRDEIRELCIAHDRSMAEQISEPVRRPPVSETDDVDVLVYKTTETPLPPAAEADDRTSDADWREAVGVAIAEVAAHERAFHRAELEAALVVRDRRIGELEGELRELKGFVNGIFAVLRPEKAAGEVVDLHGRRGHGA